MCEILHLVPNGTIEDDKLYAAAANNWHSWGLIAKNSQKKKLIIARKVPEGANLSESNPLAGGTHNDIDEIKKFLRDHEDMERFVHFRHATKGDISMDNCHPFLVYQDRRRQVFMMHNGTINSHGSVTSQIWRDGVLVPNTQGTDSDTKEFVEKRIIPTLKWVRGNYHDKDWKEQVLDSLYSKFGGQSRILFVANDLDDLKLGKFETFVNTDTKKTSFYASDVSYLNKVTRGPVFIREQAEERRRVREEEEKKGKETMNLGRGGSTNSTDIRITPYDRSMFQPDPRISQGIYRVFKVFGEQLHPHELADLYFLSLPEFTSVVQTLMKEEDGNGEVLIAGFIEHLLKEYYDLHGLYEKSKEKQAKAGLHIEELRKQIETLTTSRNNLQRELASTMADLSNATRDKGIKNAA